MVDRSRGGSTATTDQRPRAAGVASTGGGAIRISTTGVYIFCMNQPTDVHISTQSARHSRRGLISISPIHPLIIDIQTLIMYTDCTPPNNRCPAPPLQTVSRGDTPGWTRGGISLTHDTRDAGPHTSGTTVYEEDPTKIPSCGSGTIGRGAGGYMPTAHGKKREGRGQFTQPVPPCQFEKQYIVALAFTPLKPLKQCGVV